MKMRQGYVSNSSSSSFIVLGFTIKDDALEDIENLDEALDDLRDEFEVLSGSDDGIPDGETVVGVSLYDFDECGICNEATYSLQDITNKLIELRLKITNILDLDDADLKDPSIYGGVRCC